ncbi:hypothetical protein D3C76_946900 [compost metagenome]
MLAHAGEVHGAAEGHDDADETHTDPQPLQRSQTLTGQQQVQAEGGKDRRGIEEHRHVRGRGVFQAPGDEQELQGEQHARGQAGRQRTLAQPFPTAAPAHQQADQHGGDGRATDRLHDRHDIRRRHLDRHLLQSPDHAEHQHQLQDETVGPLAWRAHEHLDSVGSGKWVFGVMARLGSEGERQARPQNECR